MTTKQTPNLYAYLHTHWDREWYDTFRGYQLRLATVVDDIIDRLKSNDIPCFTLDGQTSLLEDLLELRPDLKTPLSNLIRTEKLHVGPWYTMPDEWLVCGESLLRNLQWGINDANQWGSKHFTGYLPDTFGHTGDMPQLLTHMGIDSAMLWRGVNPSSPFFQWITPKSKTSILTYHLRQGYFQNHLHDPNASDEEQDRALSEFLTKINEPHFPTLLPIGADHLGLVPATSLSRFKKEYPHTQWVHPHQFIETAISQWDISSLNTNTKETMDTWEGDGLDNTCAYVLPGVWSSRLWLKQANRACEQATLCQLEPLLVMAQRDNVASQQALQHHACWKTIWKQLLLNHAHDSIGGCSIDSVHRENRVRFEQAEQLIDRCIAWIGHDYAKKANAPVLINTLTQPYTGLIPITWQSKSESDSTSNPKDASPPSHPHIQWNDAPQTILKHPYSTNPLHIPQAHLTTTEHTGWLWVHHLPALSTQAFSMDALSHPSPSRSASSVIATEDKGLFTLKNNHVFISVDKHTGQITLGNLLEPSEQATSNPKTAPKTSDSLCTLNFIAEPDNGDSYNRGPKIETNPKEECSAHTITLAQVSFTQTGPLVASIQTTHHIQFPPFLKNQQPISIQTTFQLHAESTHITGEHQWVNTQENYRLQVGFTSNTPVTHITRENHLHEVTQTMDPLYTIQDDLPAEQFKEVMGQTFPIQRYIFGNENLIATEGLTEGETVGHSLRVTLHRGFGILSSDQTGTRGGHAGPPFKTPEGQGLYQNLKACWHWSPASLHPSEEQRHHWVNQTLSPPLFIWHDAHQSQQNKRNHSKADLSPHPFIQRPFIQPPNGVIVRALKPLFSPHTNDNDPIPHRLLPQVLRLQNTLSEEISIQLPSLIPTAKEWFLSNGLEENLGLLDPEEDIILKAGSLLTLLYTHPAH